MQQTLTPKLLTDKYINKYPDFPSHMNTLGSFVYLRTYSRYLPELGRRETWKETVRRSVEYNVQLHIKHAKKIGIPFVFSELKQEAETWFDSMFNLDQFLSGRTLWVGGSDNGVADKYPLANFNCSFVNISKWEDLGDLFYLLLVGTGVGFKSTLNMAKNLAKIKTDVVVEHVPYEGKKYHLEHSRMAKLVETEDGQYEPYADAFWSDDEEEKEVIEFNGVYGIDVGDSKEGWVEALNLYIKLLTNRRYSDVHKIVFCYDAVRDKGARLKTFGGTASGPSPLQEMFSGFDRVLKNQVDVTLAPIEVDEDGYGHVRPVHILDMGNLIGNNVVVGGVRRTAEIFLFDADDFESLWAKYGVNGYWKEKDFQKHEKLKAYLDEKGIVYPEWFEKIGVRNYDENINIDFVTKEPRREEDGSLSPFNFGTGFYHRAMSNNSIAFIDKPVFDFLDMVFKIMEAEGEPGFINLYEASRRRLVQMGITDPKLIREYAELIGLNPCAEILLHTYGVCNLTTVNFVRFVKTDSKGNKFLDVDGLIEAQRRSARAGLRMTTVQLELPHWSHTQETDRLLGTSITGLKDAMAQVGYTKEQEDELLEVLGKVAREEANVYAKYLRIPAPLLVTTVKPEGTLSQVAGGVSSGLHFSHSEYFIRRVRINADDPLAKAILYHKGWNVNPENGTQGATYEEKMKNARTYVVDFPVYSGQKITKDEISVAQQFATYFAFQDVYTEHNSSNTITVKPDEWNTARDIIFDNWSNFVGVSFLSHDGGTYQLAPYESCTKEQYEKLLEEMQAFDMSVLELFETTGDDETSLDGMDGCDSGLCPVR
jgi:ribonucleoside-diphosphate reductase alpha chain/ribonucleoside-triphosphate reductase